jgi:PIN domain nuclease of toxin-antitoxin system
MWTFLDSNHGRMMKALLDSGVWWARWHGLPLHSGLQEALKEVTEWWLCPLSIAEMLYKWRHKPKVLPGPNPALWLNRSLSGFRMASISPAAAQLAGLWDWRHGDPVDRLLCAVAKTEGLTLIHTDTVLKDLPGFPQRYFPKVVL